MDPNTTLWELLKAIKNGEPAEAMTHAENLGEWIKRGGFEPEALEECLFSARVKT